MRLELPDGAFDLSGSHRTLHHVTRPELAVAELARVTRPGGVLLVIDQIAPMDPLAAIELNRFERARDPSHTRALAEVDLRSLFEANGLVLQRSQIVAEQRELELYLDLAACEGEQRERAVAAAPGRDDDVAEIGWYFLSKPGLSA